jgi:hypothetical protein
MNTTAKRKDLLPVEKLRPHRSHEDGEHHCHCWKSIKAPVKKHRSMGSTTDRRTPSGSLPTMAIGNASKTQTIPRHDSIRYRTGRGSLSSRLGTISCFKSYVAFYTTAFVSDTNASRS